MILRMARGLKLVLIILGAVLATLVAVRAWDSQRGPQLEPLGTFVLRAPAIDATDWRVYIQAEKRIFEKLRDEVTRQLPTRDRVPLNR